ncbi:MAG: elongation factor G [Dehalococcoidia bacterium]|nr:elongation factor G [Dehalococcoidia bacterium]
MQVYATEDLRNVVVMGHGSVGKTTLLEGALFVSGAVNRMGRVEDGNTVCDYDEDEHRRKFSISLSLAVVEWEGKKITFIDTPGYADFSGEVISGARAGDLALIAVDASSGPEVGTDRAWNVAERAGLPQMIVLNRMDRENADFFGVLQTLQEKWGPRVAPLQLPIGSADNFDGVVDLLHMTAYRGSEGQEAEVPPELVEQAEELRGQLIESIVETDDNLMEKYFADEELSEDELRRVLHLGLDHRLLIPVVCTSATKTMGIRQLLHNIAYSAPSPADRDPIEADEVTVTADPDGPLVVTAFKTTADQFVGKQTYLRVFSGTLKSDTHLWNVNQGADERIAQLHVMTGKDQQTVSELHAGDIGVVSKLTDTHTGDTLAAKDNPVQLSGLAFPNPVYQMAVHPASKASVDKLGPSLQRIVEEDPSLQITHDQQTGETILGGLGDAHLDVAIDRLKRKFNVEVELSTPRVPYRETVAQSAQADFTHKKQTGGHGQYARVAIEIRPLPRGSGLSFSQKIVGGAVPKEFIPAVEKGVVEAAHEGIVAGYELTDCEIVLYDGKHHPVDSNEMSFKLAASQALKEAVQKAESTILEPVLTIRVTAPEEYAGDVVSDLNTKRARIHGITQNGPFSEIEAEVPQSEVQRYASDLRSLTQGRGSFELEFDHYGEVPTHIAQRIIEEHSKTAEAAHAH